MLLRDPRAEVLFRLPETGAYFLSDDDLENLVPFCRQLESLAQIGFDEPTRRTR